MTKFADKDWQHWRDVVLNSLQRTLPLIKLSYQDQWELGKAARKYSRNWRLNEARSHIANGNPIKALRLAILGEVMSKDYKHNNRIGHLSKDAGAFDLALLFYGASVQSSKNEKQFSEAVNELAHCAKIAGYYGLACECFAIDTSKAARVEYGISLFSLTTAFANGARDGE